MTWVSASFTSRQLYETLYVGQMKQLVGYPASPRGGLFLMPWFPMRFGDKIVANRVTPYNWSASRQAGARGP